MKADDYEYGPIMNVEEEGHNKKLVDQLKEYFDNTPKEQLEKDFFEIQFACKGIEQDDYEDGPIMHVEEEGHNKKLADQLKDYFDNTPKEQIEKDFFEIQCECKGIDPNDENAKIKLWWKDTKHNLRIISHHLGHWALKTLVIVSAWLGGIFTSASAEDTVDNIAFVVCIFFSYYLLSVLIEHDKQWFFLRKRN